MSFGPGCGGAPLGSAISTVVLDVVLVSSRGLRVPKALGIVGKMTRLPFRDHAIYPSDPSSH